MDQVIENIESAEFHQTFQYYGVTMWDVKHFSDWAAT